MNKLKEEDIVDRIGPINGEIWVVIEKKVTMDISAKIIQLTSIQES